jgi:hypothetical protein
VTKLRLEALPAGDIRRLIQNRLGVEVLPEPFARQVSKKADGNPLFAEEIVSYLTDRGIIRTTAEFDETALAAALPMSVRSLLTARVDQLAPKDRGLLQAASVIGRRFDPELLAAVTGESDVDVRLTAIGPLDLVHSETNSGDCVFKHALVRDALYESLLTDARKSLHLKIAQEIEHRRGNRLSEVAEVLAYHYRQTNQADKAFTFLSMAGSKCLGVYSLDEAGVHFTAALALLEKNPDCASDDQVAQFFVPYTLLLHLNSKMKVMIDVLERYLSRIDRPGDDERAVLIRHHYVIALLWNARYREAAALQRETSPIANRLGNSRPKAYSLTGEILVSTVTAPRPLQLFETLKKEAIVAASNTADAHIQNWTRFVIGWEEMHRGRMNEARDEARELMQVGRLLNDPRSTGFGLWLLSWIALTSESYTEALEYSEQSLAVAVTPQDHNIALGAKGIALVLLRRTEEGVAALNEHRTRCIENGYLYNLTGSDPVLGVCKVLQGNISEGIHWIEELVMRRETEGYQAGADWYRLMLCEVYLQIIGGKEKLPLPILIRNLPILINVTVTASSRIRALLMHISTNPHFHPMGFHRGRVEMILGLLYQIKKKRALALQHLTEARRIPSQFGQTPMLARVETALAELGQ